MGCAGRRRRLFHRLGWASLLLPLILSPWLPSEVDAGLAAASVGAVLATAWSGLARSGLVSFGFAAPFGAGAYAFALVVSRNGAPVFAVVCAAAAGVAASLVLALGSRWRRLPLAAFATFTLAWAEILRAGAGNLSFTGGPSGVLLATLPGSRVAAALGIGAAVLASVALAAASGPRLRPLLAAVAADPGGAEALGLPVSLTREGALAASGLAAGLAGALSAWTVGLVEPQSAFSPLVSALAMAAGVGGGGPAWGPAALGLYFSSVDQLYLTPAAPTLHTVAVAALLTLVLAVRRPLAPPSAPVGRRAVRAGERRSLRPAGPVDGSLLTVRDVRVTRGGIVALAGVDLEVAAGEVVGLVGPNGSGKTTLLDAISGLVPYGGRVVLSGRPIDRMAPHARARLGIARTFQVPHVVEGLSGRELADLGRRRTPLSLPPPLPSPAWIDLDGLGGRSSVALTPSELRRMELTRALASEARLLLLDEPAAGLAPSLIPELAGSIRAAAAAGRAVIVVEHAPSMVARVATRVVQMSGGRLAAAVGEPEERVTRPRERRARGVASGSETDPVLRARALSAGYGGGSAVKAVNLVVRGGEIVALVGPNGAGKSTLILALMGLLPSDGEVLIDGRDVTMLPPFVRASLGMAWIPEQPRVFSAFSVADHIAVAREPATRPPARDAEQRLPGIRDLLPRRTGTLSAGQRKLVLAVAALERAPRILLADDPFLGLDDTSTEQLASALDAARSDGTAVVLSGQDRGLLATLADRAYLLGAGRIVAEGPLDILWREEAGLLRGQ